MGNAKADTVSAILETSRHARAAPDATNGRTRRHDRDAMKWQTDVEGRTMRISLALNPVGSWIASNLTAAPSRSS